MHNLKIKFKNLILILWALRIQWNFLSSDVTRAVLLGWLIQQLFMRWIHMEILLILPFSFIDFYLITNCYKSVTLLFNILSAISTYGRFDFSLCWPLNLPYNRGYSIPRSSPKWASATLRKTRVMSNNLHAKNSPDITLRARSLYLDSSALIKTISLEEQGIWRRKNNYHIGYWPPGDYNFHFVIMQLMIKDVRG